MYNFKMCVAAAVWHSDGARDAVREAGLPSSQATGLYFHPQRGPRLLHVL